MPDETLRGPTTPPPPPPRVPDTERVRRPRPPQPSEIETLRATLATTTDERDLWRAEWEGITATAHELAATLATERVEGERREQLITALNAYIVLLGDECARAARVGLTHPHLAPPREGIERGAELRAQIAALSGPSPTEEA